MCGQFGRIELGTRKALRCIMLMRQDRQANLGWRRIGWSCTAWWRCPSVDVAFAAPSTDTTTF
eukprot:3725794-Amphidinium_carterae.1